MQQFQFPFQILDFILSPICTTCDSNITWLAMAVPHISYVQYPNLCTSTPEHHYARIYTLLKSLGNCLPGMIVLRAYHLICTTIPVLPVGQLQFHWQEQKTLLTKSPLTAWNNTPDEHEHKIIIRGPLIEVIMQPGPSECQTTLPQPI